MTSNWAISTTTDSPACDSVLGIPSIDREHQALMVQLNRLLSDPTAHPTTVTFIEALSQLGVELSTHFKNEEALINSTGMPKHEIEQHVEAHTEILLQYTDLNMALMNKELPSREEALTMIKGWIVEHMAQYDTRIRHHVDCEAVA